MLEMVINRSFHELEEYRIEIEDELENSTYNRNDNVNADIDNE